MHGNPGTLTWIIGNDPALQERIKKRLATLRTQAQIIAPEDLAERCEVRHRQKPPNLILLDIEDLDGGLANIEILKRARVTAPIVALTADFSRQFAMKILSQGVRYYLPREFCEDELLGVARSLLEPETAAKQNQERSE